MIYTASQSEDDGGETGEVGHGLITASWTGQKVESGTIMSHGASV